MKGYWHSLIAIVLLFWITSNCSILERAKHDLQVLNNQNFNVIVNKFRNEKVFFILFFHKNNKDITKIIENYNGVASKFKGIVTFCAMDCDQNASLCESELSLTVPNFKETNTHYLLIYPTMPLPKFVYPDEITENGIKKYLHLIPSKIDIIKDEKEYSVFMSKYENVPKVLIFSNKKKPNYLLNALSNAFYKKLIFGYVNNELKEIVDKYKVTNFPHIIIIKKGKVIDTYKGQPIYLNMFDWLNVHSETFVFGGGFDTSPDKTHDKPWKFDLIPQFTKLSHGDICFKKADQGLCLLYLKEGDKLEKEEFNMLVSLKEKYKPHIDGRGINFRFMWINIAVETNFRSLFEVNQYPSVVVFNPYKRIRYAKLSADTIATQENIEKLLEKISGGDAKFTILSGQKLPDFVDSAEYTKKEETQSIKDEL